MDTAVDQRQRQGRRWARRWTMVAGLLTAVVVPAALATAATAASAASAAPVATGGGCTVDAGVTTLWNWSMGAPPPIQVPGIGWRPSIHPTNPMMNFYVPGDWTTTILAVPAWLSGSWQAYDWSGVHVASGDGSTAVEIASAPVIGLYDTTAAAMLGLRGVFGETQPTVLCSGYSPATQSTIVVAESAGTLAYVAGYAFPDSTLGQTVLVYYAAVAPVATFAMATDSTFVAVFYQFYRNGGTDSGGDDGGGDNGDGDNGDGENGPSDTTG